MWENDHDDPPTCQRCGIAVRRLPFLDRWTHAEPRTLENNLHNGTPDHDAVVTSGT